MSIPRHLILTAAVALIVGAVGGVAGPVVLQRLRPVPSAALTDPSFAPLTMAQDRELVAMVRRVSPAVVSINVSANVKDPAARLQIGAGSGFFASTDGIIVTNKHVVDDPQAEYTVVTLDGKKFKAKVLALDPVLDLALVKVEGRDFPVLELAPSDQVDVGQTVIAIGNALAEFQNTVTKGVISGIHRHIVAGGDLGNEVIEEAIQTDAAINPGNSGGPLLDLSGRVIGVNTAVTENAQSLGFALPANAVKRDLDSVQKTGRIVRPWLGVRYLQIDDDYSKQNRLPYAYGALVVRGDLNQDPAVIPGSPADKAGIVENDIILEADGQKIDVDHSLSVLIGAHVVGDEITLKIAHRGKEKMIKVKLEERK